MAYQPPQAPPVVASPYLHAPAVAPPPPKAGVRNWDNVRVAVLVLVLLIALFGIYLTMANAAVGAVRALPTPGVSPSGLVQGDGTPH